VHRKGLQPGTLSWSTEVLTHHFLPSIDTLVEVEFRTGRVPNGLAKSETHRSLVERTCWRHLNVFQSTGGQSGRSLHLRSKIRARNEQLLHEPPEYRAPHSHRSRVTLRRLHLRNPPRPIISASPCLWCHPEAERGPRRAAPGREARRKKKSPRVGVGRPRDPAVI
jgi:hypothetical protein